MQAVTQTGTFGEYLEAWLAHAQGRVRQTTWEGYESSIRNYVGPDLAVLPLVEIHPLSLQNLYSSLLSRERPLSGGTVLNLHLILTQALGQAVRWGYLSTNPASGAQPPRPKRAELVMVDAELADRLLKAVEGTRIECVVAIAISTGMRRGEIVALRWQDITDEYSKVHVRRTLQNTHKGLIFENPKTPRSRRVIVLPEFLRPYLERQKLDQERRRGELGDAWQDNGLVIDQGDGRPYNPDSISSYWRGALRRAGLPHVRFHDLRHAHATMMLSQGVHPKIVSERLGHASIGITLDTYSHVLPSMQQDAADAFDAIFPSESPPVMDVAAAD